MLGNSIKSVHSLQRKYAVILFLVKTQIGDLLRSILFYIYLLGRYKAEDFRFGRHDVWCEIISETSLITPRYFTRLVKTRRIGYIFVSRFRFTENSPREYLIGARKLISRSD